MQVGAPRPGDDRRQASALSLRALIFRYALFAAAAAIANLMAQRVVLGFGTSPLHLMGAMATGTLVGLVVKYVLDKRWIFFDVSTGVRAHGRKFTLYTAMGIVTTAVFWGFEAVFWYVWQTDLMREAGAVLGLTIGYVLKYNLDKRFVFNNERFGLQA